ncbi:SgcJ/EcaC family oxidoreductase [Fischerella sp. PCC 9605]|uniref:SgcJ/EcaC family oxidoreductase n=1 Tax=Fischerella sp. PCC 9605 TaxID=1173024 RepID=UPI0004B22389|nr:SgcJ/EcaC family oxidoreductase [Fischerella sp. PCC 9605]
MSLPLTSNSAEEAAIRQTVQKMQDGHNTRNGTLFASAFAAEHDYIVIDGTFLPNITRQDNARSHQALYDGDRSSLGGNLGEVTMQLDVAKTRFLTPKLAVVHIQGQAGLTDQPDKRAKNIISTVMQKRADDWEIVAFHNAPIQKQEEDDFGFVIDLEGFEGKNLHNDREKE